MPQLQIFTMRGTLLDNVPCSSGECVKDLVKNAMESKKLRFEEARGIKRLKKDGSWTKIRWKDLADDDNAVYKVTRDPQRLRLKHRVRVVDYDGEEIGLLSSKSGNIVKNIVNDVGHQLGIDEKQVYMVELIRDGKANAVKMDFKVKWSDYLAITVDALDRETIVVENGEPILPKCLTVLTLKELLLNYKSPTTRTKALDTHGILKKLESGETLNEPEKRLIAKCCAPPLQEHCFKRGMPWRRESRLYLANLFEPYPQLHLTDFVTPQEYQFFERFFRGELANVKRKHRSVMRKLFERTKNKNQKSAE